jgi:N utilization substance protein A
VPGALEAFNLQPHDAEMLVLRARVAAGWISEEDLPQPEPEPEYEDDGGEDTAQGYHLSAADAAVFGNAPQGEAQPAEEA